MLPTASAELTMCMAAGFAKNKALTLVGNQAQQMIFMGDQQNTARRVLVSGPIQQTFQVEHRNGHPAQIQATLDPGLWAGQCHQRVKWHHFPDRFHGQRQGHFTNSK